MLKKSTKPRNPLFTEPPEILRKSPKGNEGLIPRGRSAIVSPNGAGMEENFHAFKVIIMC
jgi:hypothetical protein